MATVNDEPSNRQILSYLTDTSGIGGVIKERPEDFLVEEQPLYEPAGSGEHLYLYIQKRGVTTSDVVRRLVKAFRVGKGDVGYAGLKDKHAVVRQHFSIYLPSPAHDAELLKNVETDSIKVLWSQRHANKLRRGHHAGNRFVIYVRQVEPTAAVRAFQVVNQLAATGVPNYIGEQRFGYRGNNDELGRLLLLGQFKELLDAMLGQPQPTDFTPTRTAREAYERGDYTAALDAWPHHHRPERQALDALRQGRDARGAVTAIDGIQREFLVSALQSAVFNLLLHRRITGGLFAKLVSGDLAWKHDSGAVFVVDEATAELENSSGGRVSRLEVSPSGPMWGVNMTRAAGRVLEWETHALEVFGIKPEQLSGNLQARAEGVRRPMRTIITNPDISGGADEHGPYVRLAFELPRGAFATVVLREIMKNDSVAQAEGAENEA